MRELYKSCRKGLVMNKGYAFVFILLMCILFSAAGTGKQVTAFGDTVSADGKNQSNNLAWKKKNKYFYAYRNGRKLTGLQKVNGRTYLFDKKGRQQTGWRKINDKYYFFRITNGQNGVMLTGKWVNGIKLDKTGAAQVTSGNKRKLSLLVRYQALADKLVKPATTMRNKLLKVFLYARAKSYGAMTDPGYSGHWDEYLAECFLDKPHVDCFGKAAGFAYLANALGCKDVIIRKYGHAHVEIGKLIYDLVLPNESAGQTSLEFFGKTHSQLPKQASHIRNNHPYRKI